ncbi:hypothetical protein [Bacillus solitudinis]|uniref:hypothetical protein n=1 Tax=Bacillus solitudinis TaxID=2014074 RepID=UPI0012FE024F|nr:hypothetical protein [Bacillus solitudinis]
MLILKDFPLFLSNVRGEGGIYMDKYLFGKLLGETYRIQKRLNDCPPGVGDDVIYGLVNGIETVVDSQISGLSKVENWEVDVVEGVLNEIFIDPDKTEAFSGYYDIEPELGKRGVSRGKAIVILTLLKAQGRFTNLIVKMDSPKSPVECKRFELSNWDK